MVSGAIPDDPYPENVLAQEDEENYLDRIAELEAERDRYREAWERVGLVLSAEGCSCDSEEHDATCELCLGCRIEKALKGGG